MEEKTKCTVESMGRKCVCVCCDLKQECMAKRVVDKAINFCNKIDIVVNNCAVQFITDDILDITEEQLDCTLKLTYIHTFL